MQLPVIRGVIDRRILVNFQVDPDAVRTALPSPLTPKLVGSVGIGGICLIRLREIRPRFVPSVLGVTSENAAHRIAVELRDGGEGVFIPRRDTSSRLNSLAGGRLFPGVHHHSTFRVYETDSAFSVQITTASGQSLLHVRASLSTSLPPSSAFRSIDEASAFFEAGSLGYSPSRTAGKLDGLELRPKTWHIAPLNVEEVQSSYFEDPAHFPSGSVRFDSAFLMRDIHHEWHMHEPLYCGQLRRAV